MRCPLNAHGEPYSTFKITGSVTLAREWFNSYDYESVHASNHQGTSANLVTFAQGIVENAAWGVDFHGSQGASQPRDGSVYYDGSPQSSSYVVYKYGRGHASQLLDTTVISSVQALTAPRRHPNAWAYSS